MIIETKDIFTVSAPVTSKRPFLNENQFSSVSTSSTFLADKRTLMNWIKRTPEALGILKQIAYDIVTRINFVALESKNTGRPKKNAGGDAENRAEQFVKDNLLKQQLRAAVIECLALGDGYLWKSKSNKDEIKKTIKEIHKDYGIELKETEIESKAIDEDYVGQKQIQYVASATMFIELDETGTKIVSFVQRPMAGFGSMTFPSATRLSTDGMSGNTIREPRKWLPEQIIHAKFMELDGKVHGYTPMQASFPIIKTLGAIKDYHGHYFESGQIADIIFNFEEMDANSPAHETMTQIVQTWYNNKRRSHLVTTGKMKIEKINEWNKDMEFRMLAIYYTGVIAFSMGLPLEKIRAILGGEIKSSTGASDVSKTDYLNHISDMQDDWELLLNTQFFNEEFGVNLRFQRTSARDEHAEAMRDEVKQNVADRFFTMDIIKKDKRLDYLSKEFPDIPRDWLNPDPKPEMDMGMQTSAKLFPGQGSQANSDEKKKQQEPQQKNNPPSGIS